MIKLLCANQMRQGRSKMGKFMLIFIIPILSFLIGAYSGFTEYHGGLGLAFLKGILALAISFCLVMAIIGVTSVITSTHYDIVWQRELVSLQGKQSVQGEFCLGSGQIDEKIKYYYFYPTDSGYKLEYVNALKSTLSYSDDPNIKKLQQEFDSNLIRLIISPITWGAPKYHIEIPKGSIKREFVPMS